MAQKTDIHAVAKAAGVSIATVSRVQQGTAPVSPETRGKVLDAIERLGYRPNRAGRDLARRRAAVKAPTEEEEVRVAIVSDRDIAAARNEGRTLAGRISLHERDKALVLSTISALARNIVDYAGRGEIVISVIQDGDRAGLHVEARDRSDLPGEIEEAERLLGYEVVSKPSSTANR